MTQAQARTVDRTGVGKRHESLLRYLQAEHLNGGVRPNFSAKGCSYIQLSVGIRVQQLSYPLLHCKAASNIFVLGN